MARRNPAIRMVCRDRSTLVTATIESDLSSPEKESDGERPRPFDIQSHADLLHFPEIPASTKSTPSGDQDITSPVIDAIIVPTIRTAGQISSAVDLAFRAVCKLVIFYTTDFP